MRQYWTAAAIILALTTAAHAGPSVTLQDTYIGSNDHGYGDVIESPGSTAFNIDFATVTRNGDYLTITVNTEYAANVGLDGTSMGDLLIAKHWTPDGSASNNYLTDDSLGTAWAYHLAASAGDYVTTTAGAGTVLSSVPSGFIGRDGQIVSYTGGTANLSDSVAFVDNGTNTLSWTFDAAGMGLLTQAGGFDIAISWAMSCGNDVFQGEFSTLPDSPGGVASVSEPGTFATFAVALIGFVFVRRRV
jgi:hypothetical protein